MSENISAVEQEVTTEVVKASDTVAVQDDDFLAGVQAADAESFNVCISCD